MVRLQTLAQFCLFNILTAIRSPTNWLVAKEWQSSGKVATFKASGQALCFIISITGLSGPDTGKEEEEEDEYT